MNDISNHKCPNCNSSLPFNPEKGLWVCSHCNSEFTEEELKKYIDGSEEEIDVKSNSGNPNLDIYQCPSCGAQILADETTTATFCVYCKNPAIIKSRLKDEFKPQYIIPFKKTKQNAMDAFQNFKKGKWFVPNEFNNVEEISGIYIPFWLYSCDVEANMSATGRNIRTWRSGNYRYTKTDTYSVIREGNMAYNRVPADGSKQFDDSIMDSIEPFDYNDLVDFNYSYLSGFLSEKYDVNSEEAFSRAETRIKNTSRQKLESTVAGYSSVSVNSFNANLENVSNEYVLLPVWMLNTKYKDKLYPFAMNGQTGKLIGDLPVDKKKVLSISSFLFSSLSIIIFLLLYLFLG